ncbi:hypothetical protein ONE63_011590 [Megalurothrips usitatus]|uniref:HAT C-terminal dimerisation domain-containing protein n=1 Tax=Megalurothrips usitatus TaxID=439358 RepID=A0AAV7X2N4_9NEOP|nr:hypothetical protein ONE63_011590 [Megalurothrips usitatus]
MTIIAAFRSERPILSGAEATPGSIDSFLFHFGCRDAKRVHISLIPRFKLDWISDLNLRADCKAQILREMNTLLPNEDWCTVAAQTAREHSKAATAAPADADTVSEEEDDPDPERACGGGVGSSVVPGPGVSELSFEDSFYGVTVPVPVAEEAGVESAESELNRILVAPRTLTVEDCYAVRPCGTRKFPRLAQLFVKYNVALPSSATVERLFWVAGVSFADLRNMLGDNNLENEVLLRVNKKFWEKECLLRLYGNEQLESKHLTAKGTRAGTLGIPDDARLAIKEASEEKTRGSPFSRPASSSPLKSPSKLLVATSPPKLPKPNSPVKPSGSQVGHTSVGSQVVATSPWKVVPQAQGPSTGSTGSNIQSNDWNVHSDFPAASWNASPWQQHPQHEYNQYYYGNAFQQSSNSLGAPWQHAGPDYHVLQVF